MKDIARDLGVSVITVSKALRNHPDISDATRERVLRRAKELNYSPNLAARALVTGRTHLMGLVVPNLVHSFFAEVARGVSHVLRRSGFSLVISSSEEDPELEKEVLDHLLAREVDVLLVASVQSQKEAFSRVEQQKMPYILVDRRISGLEAPFVGVRDDKVGEIATAHLLQIGCRTVAHICGTRVSTALGRLQGYRRTLEQHGLKVNPDYVVAADKLDEAADLAGYKAAMNLLALDPRPDGIFCFNDPVAIGAMKAVLEKGFHIPEDIALIGSGNLYLDNSLRVALSTIDQQSELIGRRAARLALSLVEDASVQPAKIFVTPKLIIRDSTRR